MARTELSFTSRKALRVQLGDAVGEEVDDLLRELIRRIEMLERNKVDVTPIVPLPEGETAGSRRRAA